MSKKSEDRFEQIKRERVEAIQENGVLKEMVSNNQAQITRQGSAIKELGIANANYERILEGIHALSREV